MRRAAALVAVVAAAELACLTRLAIEVGPDLLREHRAYLARPF